MMNDDLSTCVHEGTVITITVVSNWIAREEITIIEVGKNAKDTNFFYKLNRDEITINEAGKMLKIPTFLPKKKKITNG